MTDKNKPRYLTLDEIENILDRAIAVPGVKPKGIAAVINRLAPYDVRLTVYNNILTLLRAQLGEISVTPLAFDDLVEHISTKFMRAQMDSESAVGLFSSEAISGPITQMALNAFHQSGSNKNVGSGIDMLRSLLHLSEPHHPSVDHSF